MRILMLTPRAPYPADHGAALRNLSLLKWLSRRHEVSLMTFGNPDDTNVAHVLQEYARRVRVVPPPRRSRLHRLIGLGASRQPDLARRLWSPVLVARLREMLEQFAFDLVQIEGLEMFGLWAGACAGRRGIGPIVVLDEHNAEYSLQHTTWQVSLRARDWLPAFYSLVQAQRLRRYERQACRTVHGVIMVSTADEASLRSLYPQVRSCVVPNGVDTTHYCAGGRETDGATVLFIGKMDYRPNVDAIRWFCSDIWPAVRTEIPHARLLVVGRDLGPEHQPLAKVPGIQLVGAVPDERPWFDRSDLLVVPMRMGSGTRIKVLQAMAMGVPVVSTVLGISGVTAVNGSHYLLADSAAEFARQIVVALKNPALRRALGETARQLASEQYDWTTIAPRLDHFYEELIGVSGSR
ncbi:MAG TPA: glycosyltransferase [Chloroflexota bacterium]|nr:glycosyltransferase [Chloroflexota bacterium]